jgi:hypothetical protein
MTVIGILCRKWIEEAHVGRDGHCYSVAEGKHVS